MILPFIYTSLSLLFTVQNFAYISVSGSGDPELWITDDLRFKIKDLKIDPQSLSYNPKSQPLGKGTVL